MTKVNGRNPAYSRFSVEDTGRSSLVSTAYFLVLSFPFIGLPGVNFDTQPWAYLSSLLAIMYFVLARKLQIPYPLLTPLVVSLIAILFKLFLDVAFYIPYGYEFSLVRLLRQIFSYTSIYVILVAVFMLGRLPSRNLYLCVYFVWFASGPLQMLFPELFNLFLPRISTSETRGVTGLASEPTHYARQMGILFAFALYLFRNNVLNRNDLLRVSMFTLISILFISRSFTGLAFILPVVFLSALVFYERLRVLLIPLAVVFFVVMMWLAFEFLPQSRLVQLTIQAYSDPYSLQAYGAFRRISNAPTSLYVGFVQYYGLGLGFGRDIVHLPNVSQASMFSSFSVNPHGGVIGIIYLAGLFGLPWVYLWLKAIFYPSILSNDSKGFLRALGLCLLVFCFFEGTTAQPFLLYVIAIVFKTEYRKFQSRHI